MGCDFEAMKNFYSLKPVDLDILCSGLFFHHINMYSFMFVRKISTWVVCVNSKYLVFHYWTGINFLIGLNFRMVYGFTFTLIATMNLMLTVWKRKIRSAFWDFISLLPYLWCT